MTLAFRPAASPDMVFVIDAWVKSSRHSHTAGNIHANDWRPVMWPQVERVIEMPGTRTIVAYETDDSDHVADLYGFISVDTVAPPPIVYYAYVKEAYRCAGVARSLFAAAGVDPSHPFSYGYKTSVVAELVKLRKLQSAKFDPSTTRFDNPRRERDEPTRDQEARYRRAQAAPVVIERRRPAR